MNQLHAVVGRMFPLPFFLPLFTSLLCHPLLLLDIGPLPADSTGERIEEAACRLYIRGQRVEEAACRLEILLNGKLSIS